MLDSSVRQKGWERPKNPERIISYKLTKRINSLRTGNFRNCEIEVEDRQRE